METDSTVHKSVESTYVNHYVPEVDAIGAVVFPHSTATQAQNIKFIT